MPRPKLTPTDQIAKTSAENARARLIAVKKKEYLEEGKSDEFAAAYARAQVLGDELMRDYRAGAMTHQEMEAELLRVFAEVTPISIKFDGFLSSVKRGNLSPYKFIFEGSGSKAIAAKEERETIDKPEPWKPNFKVLDGGE